MAKLVLFCGQSGAWQDARTTTAADGRLLTIGEPQDWSSEVAASGHFLLPHVEGDAVGRIVQPTGVHGGL